MESYKKIDIDTWVRREHYLYYTQKLKIEYNMTANINVKELLDFCHIYNYKFYPAIIYFITKVLNKIDNFKMFKDKEQNLCIWDKIIPNYTIFHKDDCTFSDCWTDYSDDFKIFYYDIMLDMKRYKDKKGIKVKVKQPSNFYCVSCTPWTTFTGYGSRVMDGEPTFFPIITIGKYVESGQQVMMPVNITIAHAVSDGYHVGLFFQYLQEELTKQNLLTTIEDNLV